MTLHKMDVLVVGAGVSGLTTAVCLAERLAKPGMSVVVRARDLPPNTTSCAAGAMWGSVLAAHERASDWSKETLLTLWGLANQPRTGVRLVHGMEASRVLMEAPDCLADIDDVRECRPDELPAGFICGWQYTAPIVDMRRYLHYLRSRLINAGGRIECGNVESLEAATAEAAVVVNCAGADARLLVPDPSVVPTRGQLVVVDNPGIDWFFAEADQGAPTPTYFLPHGDHIVVGGTVEPGRVDAVPDPAAAAAILRRCATIEPSLATARVREHRVGFRPVRPTVRVEHTLLGEGHVIHNYGHGGGGLSLSWGCALEIQEMVEALELARP